MWELLRAKIPCSRLALLIPTMEGCRLYVLLMHEAAQLACVALYRRLQDTTSLDQYPPANCKLYRSDTYSENSHPNDVLSSANFIALRAHTDKKKYQAL